MCPVIQVHLALTDREGEMRVSWTTESTGCAALPVKTNTLPVEVPENWSCGLGKHCVLLPHFLAMSGSRGLQSMTYLVEHRVVTYLF